MEKLMKKLLLGVALVASLFIASGVAPQAAHATSYTVALTTYVPTASVGDYALGAYPNVTGTIYARQVIVTNNNATAQRITAYTNCTSSTSADTVAFIMDIPATIGTYSLTPNWILPQALPLVNPCFNRSSTTGVTNLDLLYE